MIWKHVTTLCWRHFDLELTDTKKSLRTSSDLSCITDSPFRRHIIYSCPTNAGDSSAALVLKDGYFIGIHLETINALRQQIERKKIIRDRLTDVEESLARCENRTRLLCSFVVSE